MKRVLDNEPRVKKQIETSKSATTPASMPISIEVITFSYLSKRKDCEIFIIFLRDIKKVLKPKEIVNLRTKLFKKYYEFLPLFNKAATD